jgi:hypothetical protein
MKKLLAAMFVAVLLVGCGDSSTSYDPVDSSTVTDVPESSKAIDFDDLETRKGIIAEAITVKKFERRGEKGEELFYASNEQTPYTGWLKVMYGNGQIKVLGQLKDGKPSRLTRWCVLIRRVHPSLVLRVVGIELSRNRNPATAFVEPSAKRRNLGVRLPRSAPPLGG